MSESLNKEEMMNEARLFYLSQSSILPLLERRRKAAHEKVLHAYREGKADLRAEVASLEAYENVIKDIISKAKRYEAALSRGEE